MPWTMQITVLSLLLMFAKAFLQSLYHKLTVERLFSAMKLVLSGRRTSMKNELLYAILFLRTNWEGMK